MAKILICTTPFAGHVNAALPIATKLVERGNVVWWYTGQRFSERVEESGAHFVAPKAGLDFDDQHLDESFPGRKGLSLLKRVKWDVKHILTDAAPGQLADLSLILSRFPADVILAYCTFLGAPLAYEKKLIPVWASLGITLLTSSSRDTAPFGAALPPDASRLGRVRNQVLNWLFYNLLFGDLVTYTNDIRRQVGLSEGKGSLLHTPISPFLHLQSTVPEFEYPRTDLPSQVRFIGPGLSTGSKISSPTPTESLVEWWPELIEQKKSGRPVIHVTQGTVETEVNQLIVPTIKALAGEEVFLVVTTGGRPVEEVYRALEGTVWDRGRIKIEQFIPHVNLLPQVDLMITNAGYNSVQMALAQGVPLIAAGRSDDKAEISARIGWSGVGIDLKTKRPSPQQIREAVQKVLSNPAYQRKAKELQQVIASYDGPTLAAGLLEELALNHSALTPSIQ